jgi:hypothetical protein
MRKSIVILVALLGCAIIERGVHAQSLTTGAIQGVISDAQSGEPLIGVTIIVTSPALQQQQGAITDEIGQYKISNLPPGSYALTCIYAGITVRRTGVVVSIDKTTPGYVKIDTTQTTAEVITVEGRAPAIDPTSTIQGFTLDQDFVKNLPVGRSYADNLTAAAGASADDAGVSFSGSSSLENMYTVDGINTTTLVYGQVGSPVVNEFIQETEIITGGYNAEFGRSTGGVINVVTKSGSNELHGSLFGYASPGQLIAGAQATPTQTASIDSESNLVVDSDFGFEIGGPIVKDRLWFYAGLAPHVERENLDRITKRRMDCHKLQADGSLSMCDPAFADGVPDTDPETGFLLYEELDRERLRTKTTSYPFIGKLNLAVSPEHQGYISLIGTPASGNNLAVDGLPGATHFDYTDLTTDLSAKWTSKLDDNHTELETVVGWHRSTHDETPIDATLAGLPRQNLYYGDLGTWGQLGGESGATVAGCTDGGSSDPYPKIRNCPDEGTGYAIGGPGALADSREERLSARVSIIERLVALGHHEWKAGVDLEDNRLRTRRQTTGDQYFDVLLPHDGEDGQTMAYRFVRLARPGNPDGFAQQCPDTDQGSNQTCDFIGGTNVLGETVNWAAYLRDSWQIVPSFTVNAGLRYEEQRVRYAKDLQDTVDPFTGEYRGKNAMELRGMWAPRVGAVYDWTGEGRSKIYAHWGRFFESVPMDLNSVNFGGETTFRRTYASSQCGAPTAGIGAPDGPSCLAAGDTPAGSNVFGSGVLVAPGVKPQYMDEAILGVEYALADDFKIGLAYHDRRLGRVLEDVSPDETVTYVLANPGEFPTEEEERLQQQIDATTDMAERTRLEDQLSVFKGIRRFDKPKRIYNAIQVTAVKRFSRSFFLQASYTYARTRGNFPGLYSPDNGAIQPNISAQYDLVELLANRDGPLPQDRPHDLKIDGYYVFDFEQAGSVTTGARTRFGSGTPVDALAGNALYGFDESFVLPRGAIGRTKYDVGIDLHLSYGRDLGKGMRLEAFTDLFNVFNRQGEAYVDETYTHDNVNPIVGGDGTDLVWAKASDADGNEPDDPLPPARNRNFRNAKTRTPPFAARLGARLTF